MSRQEKGQSTVELALILPMFLLMLALVVDGGRAYYRYLQVQQVAREAVFYGTTHGGDVAAMEAMAQAHASDMGLLLSQMEVNVHESSSLDRTITVTVTYHMNTILLGIAGYPTLTLEDTAQAMAF